MIGGSNCRRKPASSRAVALALSVGVLLAALALAPAVGSGATCSDQQVEVGIVKATACFTKAVAKGSTVYTADGDHAARVDLNGFVITLKPGQKLTVDTKSQAVSSGGAEVQLNSVGWPSGVPEPLGEPMALEFVAPNAGEMTLEDLRFTNQNALAGTIAGFSPINAETPVKLVEGGTGTMNLVLELTGAFTLKGKRQTAKVLLRTEPGKGTILDGFKIKLNKVDSFKWFTINELELLYDAAKKELKGDASIALPVTTGKGFGGSFLVVDGQLEEIGVNATGISIPIGEVGELVKIAGKFGLQSAGIDLGADLGPHVKVPVIGDVALARVDAGFDVRTGPGGFFDIHGDVKLFTRLDVSQLDLKIYFSGALDFDFGIGIGVPSFSNNRRDPFYLGMNIDGWIDDGKYNFQGGGHFSLFGAKLLKGQGLISNRGIGACWKVVWVPGGAVLARGSSKVHTFGVRCGIGSYVEKKPAQSSTANAAALGRERTLRLGPREQIVEVVGAGGPPRFVARSGNRVLTPPPPPQNSKIEEAGGMANSYAFFLNEDTNRTHLLVPKSAGRWRLTAVEGSAPIRWVRAGRQLPTARARAEVRGHGARRTLVWNSRDLPRHQLEFAERLPGGALKPILHTDRPAGRYRFTPHRGSHYGRRELRLTVLHGGAPRSSRVADAYRVNRLRPPPRPRRVTARRDVHDVIVRWRGVRRAHRYLVLLRSPRTGQRHVQYVREVGARARRVSLAGAPTLGRTMAAIVIPINRDGAQGRPRGATIDLGPAARSLPEAARLGLASFRATAGGSRARMLARCPEHGHCQGALVLRAGGRTVLRKRFTQVPDTVAAQTMGLPRRIARRLRAGATVRVGARLELRRGAQRAVARRSIVLRG